MDKLLQSWIDDDAYGPEVGCVAVRLKLKDDQLSYGGLLRFAEGFHAHSDEPVYAFMTAIPTPDPTTKTLLPMQTEMHLVGESIRWAALVDMEKVVASTPVNPGSRLVIPSA